MSKVDALALADRLRAEIRAVKPPIGNSAGPVGLLTFSVNRTGIVGGPIR